MTLDKIWEYVNSNKEELSKLGIKFNKHEVDCGDEYRREDGVSYFLYLLNVVYYDPSFTSTSNMIVRRELQEDVTLLS